MSNQYLSETVKNIPNSILWKFFDLANSIPGAISLGVGEPDFPTPWHICEEGIYSIEKGRTFYTASRGLIELRQGICDYYRRRFDITYSPENCLVTVGGSEAIDLAMRSILNPGDEVILLDPGYIAYAPAVILSKATPVLIPLKEEDGFKLTYEALKKAITPKTKMILLNFPGNPTGGIMRKEDYSKIVSLIKEHNIVVVSDEIYAELTYGNVPFCSPANFDEIKDQCIVINGFSKAYSMTGWRLGYVLANKDIISAMNNIHQYVVMSPSTITQYAGIEAITKGDKDIAIHKESFESRRNWVVNTLKKIGLPCPVPEGAFYVFPSIKFTGLSSEEFCERLLREQKVAVIPGNAFGPGGEGYIRISYAYSLDSLKESFGRIEKFLEEFK